jgi:hypothetical protein
MARQVRMFSGVPFEQIYQIRKKLELTEKQAQYLERVKEGYVRDPSSKVSREGNAEWQMEQNILKKYWRWVGVNRREMA